ncbi:MAG: GTPase Era [Anaerolineae bacterium]|nr:GTPase Era [Chloroflexota bacterium]
MDQPWPDTSGLPQTPDIPDTPLLDDELPPDHHSGFVAIVGKPNVGKSTLLNHWLGVKVAAVSSKPQTTRSRLLGILTREDAQVIFVDTPGVHHPRTALGDYMVSVAESAVPDADLVLLMVDLASPLEPNDQHAAALVQRFVNVPAILVMNKIDALDPSQQEARQAAYRALGQFDREVVISARQGTGTDALLEEVLRRLPLGPRFYPADQLTDQSERFVAAELIREKVLENLRHEVPHAVAVMVTDFLERDNGVLYLAATIFTEQESQKGIVIGARGSMLKRIGSAARVTLEEFFGQPVYVDLWVKVRRNWRTDPRSLRELGYG